MHNDEATNINLLLETWCNRAFYPPPAAGPAEQLELVGELLKELSQSQAAEQGPEERRGTLLELLKVAREDSLVVWEEHFKTMLLLLLETLGDKDVRT